MKTLACACLFLLSALAPGPAYADVRNLHYDRMSAVQPSPYRFGFQPERRHLHLRTNEARPVIEDLDTELEGEAPGFSTILGALALELSRTWSRLVTAMSEGGLFRPSVAFAEQPVEAQPPRMAQIRVEREAPHSCHLLVCEQDRLETAEHELFLNTGEQLERF